LLPVLLREGWRRRDTQGPLPFFLLSCLFCLAFFSLAGSKRPGYILPAMPPLALALGCCLESWRRREWLAVGVVTFGLLAAADLFLLPSYAGRFALRDQVRALAQAESDVPIYCYPHRWDSVSYYLGCDHVHGISADKRADLVAELQAQPRSLVIVKNEGALTELLSELPETVEFLPVRTGPVVTVGWVQPRVHPSAN
jgi:hypothetical protein